MKKTILILLILAISILNANAHRLGCDDDWGDIYAVETFVFTPDNRTVAYNVTLGDEVNATDKGFAFATYVWMNTTGNDLSFTNYAAVILLNESEPILPSFEDYNLKDSYDQDFHRNESVIVHMNRNGGAGAHLDFPFVENLEQYYPHNTLEHYLEPVFFNGSTEEREKVWSVDNPYTIKIVIYYQADRFPSPLYGFFVHARLDSQICAGGFTTLPYEEKTPVPLFLIPITLTFVSLLRKKHIAK